jgi:hypothetical protein
MSEKVTLKTNQKKGHGKTISYFSDVTIIPSTPTRDNTLDILSMENSVENNELE